MPIGSIRKAAPVIYPFQLWVRSCSLKTSVSTLCVNTFQTTLASICCPLSLSLPLCLSLSLFAFVHVYLYCLVYLLPFLTWPWHLFLSFLAHRLCALCHILFIFCQFCVTFRATLPTLYTYIYPFSEVDQAASSFSLSVWATCSNGKCNNAQILTAPLGHCRKFFSPTFPPLSLSFFLYFLSNGIASGDSKFF